MSKIIETGSDSRTKLLSGVKQLANAVVTTLGPNGRNVVIAQQGGMLPQSTKDGVTVAKTVTLKDPVENLGAQMVKQAAVQTGDTAGDGTTTSTLLAKELISEGMNHTNLSQKHNAVAIKRGMDKTAREIVKHLKEMSTDIASEDQIKQVATISANNDIEVGNLIAASMDKVGREGVVTVEESKSYETTLETVEGMQFDRGYKSPYFVTDNSTMQAQLDDPYILLYDGRISQVKELLPILQAVSAQGKSLLVIAEDIDNEALATLIVNKMRGTVNVCAVKAPDFGDRRKLALEDIAITTGGIVFDKQKGMKLDKFSWEWFGEARTVTIEKEQTTIVDGKGGIKEIETRIEELQQQVGQATTPFETEKLQERLAKFTGGVAIIHVGGNTETEMKEKKDRVDDALHATKAAIEEGIVPGGGTALLYASSGIEVKSTGASIVVEACAKPFNQILVNAGFNEVKGQILADNLVNYSKNEWDGYNIKTDETVNMKEAGIIDPTKVARTALQNAASVAGTVLLTECTVVNEPSDDNNQQQQMDPMMGMM